MGNPFYRDYKGIGSILVIFLLTACSSLEQSENEKVRRLNCKAESIYRNHNDTFHPIGTPLHTPRAPYPWEGNLPRITKEFFRCKGSPTNPPIIDPSDPQAPLTCADCDSRHGLPVIQGQENVYPIFIDLLNHLQKRTGKRVIITSGHRCPAHNIYVDPSKENRTSKHQIGAEVDFYVQGMEDKLNEIIPFIAEYYRETAPYKGNKDYENFLRYEKEDVKLTTKPWFNKEIFIKLQLAHEGRNADNRHPYPYLSIQVRHDRQKNEKVVYDWKKANLGFPRG